MKPNKVLDDYQLESRDFLTGRNFAGLFDEPGVGKTGPAIIAGWHKLQQDNEYDGGPYNTVLITCPAYLIGNWVREIRDFLPMATVATANGNGATERKEALSRFPVDFVITSYNNWSASTKGEPTYPELLGRKWSAMIFDEAHRLRGHQSQTTKQVVRSRLAKAVNRETPMWLLTGTPFVRDGGDFFVYFNLYNKKKYGSYRRFVQDRCITNETPWGTQVGNIRKSYTEEFRRELAEFSLRRTVKDIPKLQNLEFEEHEYFVNMPPSVVKAIKKAKKEYVLEHEDLAHAKLFEGAGALYVAQRQLATNPPTKVKPKIDWLKDYLTDRKGRVVVYVWYKDSAKLVHESIGAKDRLAYLATGDMSADKRLSSVDFWREDPNGVLVATIPALKEGISLTEASEVVFLEHSELPSDQEQTIKRLCRRGQNKVVQVHHIHARDTVDMAIRKVLQNRNLGITEALAKWVSAEDDESWFT